MTSEQKQKLFNYFLQEHKVMLLDGDFNEIENMLTHQIGEEVIKQAYADGFNKGFVVDWETAETKTITSYYEEWKQLHPELFQKFEKSCDNCFMANHPDDNSYYNHCRDWHPKESSPNKKGE